MTNNAIRKAAILISTLDNASGDALLEQMGPEVAERVRNALMELEEIPEGEQQQVHRRFYESRTPAAMTAAWSSIHHLPSGWRKRCQRGFQVNLDHRMNRRFISCGMRNRRCWRHIWKRNIRRRQPW